MAYGMLTIAETAQLLNVHINTVRRWSDQGLLKSYRIGTRGDRRFRQEDIYSFISGMQGSPDSLPGKKGNGQQKIVVADDDGGIRQLIRSMLEGEYTVIEARDGNEAVNMTRRHIPDVVLMDILMPDTDGYTACRTIKQEPSTAHIPVVMITGIAYEMNKKLSIQMGADGYLTKPFDHGKLNAAIATALGRGAAVNS